KSAIPERQGVAGNLPQQYPPGIQNRNSRRKCRSARRNAYDGNGIWCLRVGKPVNLVKALLTGPSLQARAFFVKLCQNGGVVFFIVCNRDRVPHIRCWVARAL